MSSHALDVYLTGLRNQHAVETQAIGTLQNEMSYTEGYPDLHARMRMDKERSTTQAARLDQLLDKHGSAKSLAKELVAGTVATVAGFAHLGSSDDVLKNVLAAIGYKAYEIASYKALIALAQAAGVGDDTALLEQSVRASPAVGLARPPRLSAMKEEQEMGDWLGEHLPAVVRSYLQQVTA